ncbi:MAG: hypothetical protein COZ06_37850 [Armatimonadetes bacterium CG_4_10_14_3_um_filter_66_18]|nr:hypothetical protein [Armatimonadota bacterium]PIU89714.1 MAG: hypothetical protein COS65_27670 [Armatimonadetes bacterium CG06_land_8_20_14_3_00_66_21]PIX46460.1 MAG: hypothetical protein COZ57_11975 [Armatimonadetes bacterium CG_4_8_14_3_um_filter_66_20]PIY35626.1 MAG: hypothetical protein COZ06_37850 [Armatimonadetes bacterium CG_4_10_14_3_um_filter_66_18]PIZ48876.1 MAG: hypothetical protein COY42_05365 [Armatimonadetes bacterium CG_4_10_14_0_8_um_filter_66_14]PJB63581.1 MAG: hypothetica
MVSLTKCFALAALAVTAPLLAAPAARPAQARTITVTAGNQDVRETPVSGALPADAAGIPLLTDAQTKQTVPCQLTKADGHAVLWWIERDLKRGAARTYRLSFAGDRSAATQSAVAVTKGDTSVEVTVGGQLLTRYVFADTPKPYCYPLIGPTGKPLTRSYPMEKVAGESTDHMHHRSAFWFTHDDVNGQRFWTEGGKQAREVHREFEALESGPVFGRIRARNDWIGSDDKKVCEDVRELRVYNTTNGELVDFTLTLRATEGDVSFGDTKEGTFGFRMAQTMNVGGGGQGHIENANGDKDGAAWGKRAEWCDYYGPVAGDTVGIAVMDAPTNFRHPTHWHVRTYGLFAANPFGLRAFSKAEAGPGGYTLKAGESLTLRYRVWLHSGTTAEANVAQAFAEYATPPKVELRDTPPRG